MRIPLILTLSVALACILPGQHIGESLVPTVPLEWQVILDHPDFPTDDVVVAALQVTDSRLRNGLPEDPSKADCTATFQEAIDEVWRAGGGTVFVPAGEYLLQGELQLRERVTLRGRWQPPSEDGWQTGTVLMVAPPTPAGDGSPFLTLGKQSGLHGLSFWYPGQGADKVVPYPFTVHANAGMNTVLNVTFVNAYRAINAINSALSVFRGVYGTAIKTGMVAGNGVAFPRFEGIEFSPRPWQWWPTDEAVPNPDQEGNYAHAMASSGTGLRLREMDGCNWFHTEISGYAVGIVTEDQSGTAAKEGSGPHGHGFHVHVHDCRTALQIRCGSMHWHASHFEGTEHGIEGSEHGSASVHGGHVSGGASAVRMTDVSDCHVALTQCVIHGSVVAEGQNRIKLRDCDFTSMESAPVRAANSVEGSVWGCRLDGEPMNLRSTKRLSVNHQRTDIKPLPPIGLDHRRDWNRNRKPAKPDLFNVMDPSFGGGAKGDGRTDDSAPIRAAIQAARRNGGGIVLLPTGYYRVTESFDVGEGVELRGAAGSRYHAGAGQINATTLLMSVLMVETEGPADGTPLLTLGTGSGLRGLLIFYPKQNWKRVLTGGEQFRPYPYTIRAHGARNYIIGCSAPNPYQFADFDGAVDFLVEFCLTGGVRNVYSIRGGARIGRIQTSHVKPAGFMGGLTDVPNSKGHRQQIGELTARTLEVFRLGPSSNITLAGVFTRSAHRIATIDGAGGRAVLVGGERVQNGFVFERAAESPFDLIECGANAGRHGNETGKHAVLLKDSFDGVARLYGGHFGGTSDYLYRVERGALVIQDARTPSFGYRAPRAIHVEPHGSLELVRTGVSRSMCLRILPGGRANLRGCDFPRGIPLDAVQGILKLTDVHSAGNVAIVAPGLLHGDAQGLELSDDSTERIRLDRSWACRLTDGDAFEIDVTAKAFAAGAAATVQVRALIYVDEPCEVALSYDGVSGHTRAQFRRDRQTSKLKRGFNELSVRLRGARFGNEGFGPNSDLRLTFPGADLGSVRPALSMVSTFQEHR